MMGSLETSRSTNQILNWIHLYKQRLFHLTPKIRPSTEKMSEKLCLQWNDFKDNINSVFEKLREDKEFTDVTLACEDGLQMEAHKVILTSSSPFFEKILQKSKHPHPLIFLKGFQSKDFVSILDFLYFGEANVYQENLDSFLAIAEEIQLKGLTGQTPSDLIDEWENPQLSEPAQRNKDIFMKQKLIQQERVSPNTFTAVTIPDQSRTDLQALDERVKSMMENGQKKIPNGKDRNGRPILAKSWICKVCGKEDKLTNVIQHIEGNHLEGLSIPCDYCSETLSSRNSLRRHKSKFHL